MSFIVYKLVRSKRKSVALSVARDATLTVRAPFRLPVDRVESFIHEKRAWVEQMMVKMRIRMKEVERRYEEGEKWWYLGERYPLRLSEQSVRPLDFSRGEFVLSRRFHSRAKARFLDWYKREAKRILSERARFFARKHGLEYTSLKVNAARTRWGSCGGKGNINFSFRLVMAPRSVIDYVVVHELAHLAHRNHSKDFWRAVVAMCPDFESARKWLKENGHRLEH